MAKQIQRNKADAVFDFEELDAYHLALRFVHKLMRLLKSLPPELQSSLGNRVIGAGISTVNSIAQGSGKESSEQKGSCYRAGLNSARECIPLITVLHREGSMTDASKDELRKDCSAICKKIEELIQSVQ